MSKAKRINLSFSPGELKKFCDYTGLEPTDRGLATEAKRIITTTIKAQKK